ncbi:AraC family transcriptional regulator [Clostridium sp.]|uniref:helix-turn-helix domain-containing protein n=1 Tax=Clostridium sp. TaxID=1506 RepID=UPI00283E3B05|nr:AraC family transcriptional regulator [Clostridium sp.]MDR3593714.1 AraC family transcriptional regulator [Clostridium sp.]
MKLEIKKDVIYRCIGTDFTNGILACGYMTKPQKEQSQYNFLIDYYSCFLLLSGSGFYYAEDSTKIPIHAGDFIQRLPGICHSTEIIPDGNWLEFFISFGRTTYDYLCSLNVLPTDTPIMKVNFDDSTIHRFSRFLEQLKKATDAELPYLLLKAQEIVLSIVDCTQKNYSEYSLKEVMDEACRLLSSEINTTISLEDVALTLHMSYENFRKQFRRFIGLSPSQYRIQQKMKHAKLMLLSGISIKETAFLTGYSDTYSFTKQFTHSVGISPGRYKQMS